MPDVFRFKKTNSQKQYYWKIHLCLNCKPFMTVSLNDIGELCNFGKFIYEALKLRKL
jgi:hypothetical protein